MTDMTEKAKVALPKKHLVPLVPIRDIVIFPHTEIVLTFGRKKSVLAIDRALRGNKLIALVTQINPNIDEPGMNDLYTIGTLCTIERTLKSDGELNALVRGHARIKIAKVESTEPLVIIEAEEIPDLAATGEEVEALARHLTTQFKEAVNLGKSVEFLNFMKLMSGVTPSELADQVASTLNIKTSDKQKILENIDVKNRLYQVLSHLNHEVKILQIEKNIASKTQEKFSQSMREAVLRERMQTIKKELGEMDEGEEDLDELRRKVKKLVMPVKDKQKVLKDLHRLSQMSPHNPEANYIRTWLDTVVELPWGKHTSDRVSLKVAEGVLNADHYGLEEVKERILEYLAVMKLKKKETNKESVSMPTILCFAGPPGVGKTSIGRSIAKSLKREFVKVSLGGIRDEAEIRGHRRTYVGALPGRIIEGIRQAGTANPVFILDEIDKVGADFHGDPSAALLEVLDPEQNKDFTDHYLDLAFDLSQVMFITTANVLDTIPPALRDRLEVIRFAGYTENEKFHIAKQYLIPKVLQANSLTNRQIQFEDAALHKIIRSYTSEAGVRNLERELAKVSRRIARKIAGGNGKTPYTIKMSNVSKYLGPEKFLPTVAEKVSGAGIATGLAWTQAGGEILFIEVAIMPGSGKLVLTGKLGEVMQESAKAAFSYVRSAWRKIGLDENFYKNIDIHIHVPEGAVPKDGPSAGVTIVTAIVSALTKQPTRKEIGMTGEITLRGRVMEIGGVKEKVIAAHSAGLKQVILPEGNKKDLVDIPEEIKKDLKFSFAKNIDEIIATAIEPEALPPRPVARV